ncbi:MAG: hypothetical protein ACR2NX_14725 [Chthoniobacterales bacterium]
MKVALALTLCLTQVALAKPNTPAPSPSASSTKPAPSKNSTATDQWNEITKTSDAAGWIARLLVSAQATNRAEIATRLQEMLKGGGVEMPCSGEGLFFFLKQAPDAKRASIYFRKGLYGNDELLVDGADVKATKEPALSIFDVAQDGSLLVYGVREADGPDQTVHVLDLKTKTDMPETLPSAQYNTVSLRPRQDGFYYTRVEPTGTLVFLHHFGTHSSSDELIFGNQYNYEALGPKDLISSEVTANGEFLILSVRRGQETKRVDLYTQEQGQDNERIRPVIHAINNDFSWVSHGENVFVLTDNDAPKNRVLKVMINDPHPTLWAPFLPEGEKPLSGIGLVGDTIFVHQTEGRTTQARLFNLQGKPNGQIVYPASVSPERVYFRCPSDRPADSEEKEKEKAAEKH